MQELARQAIERILRNPDGPAAALVAIDLETGAVKAMFGGRNFRESQFNLAAQAKRQPGSAFKPIVLATAMGQGISPLTELESKKVSIDAGDRIWPVTNYDHTYLGRVSLARAMVSSDNTVYAQLTDLVGPKAIVETAHEPRDQEPARRVLLDRARLRRRQPARDGARVRDDRERRPPRRRLALRRHAPRGRAVERIRADRRRREPPEPSEVMEPGEAEILTVDPAGRRPSRAPASAPRVPGVQVAGKTGTNGQLRRCLVRRLHPGARGRRLGRLPGRAAADDDRVRRRAGHGRNAPGADLEGVREPLREGEGRPAEFVVRKRAVPRRGSDVGREARRQLAAATTATAAARGSSCSSRARARKTSRTASRTRSRFRP